MSITAPSQERYQRIDRFYVFDRKSRHVEIQLLAQAHKLAIQALKTRGAIGKFKGAFFASLSGHKTAFCRAACAPYLDHRLSEDRRESRDSSLKEECDPSREPAQLH